MSHRAAVVPDALVALLVLLAVPALVAAQAGVPEGAEVAGVVVDAATGEPIPFALVKAAKADLTVATDARGRFVLGGAPPGPLVLEVSHLGYGDAVVEWAGEGATPLRVELAPDPIEIQGLKVMTSRFAHRRYGVPIAVNVLDAETLATWSGDALELLRSRASVMITSCAGTVHAGTGWCVMSRGQRLAPTVYVDEFRAFQGLDALAFHDARDLHAIEVFAHGRQIRVYTRAFMERMARSPQSLIPLGW